MFDKVETNYDLTKNQLTTPVVDGLKYQVLYMAALEKAYEAVDRCTLKYKPKFYKQNMIGTL